MREWPQLDVVHERLPLDDDIAVAAVIAAVDAVIAVIDVAVIDAVVTGIAAAAWRSPNPTYRKRIASGNCCMG